MDAAMVGIVAGLAICMGIAEVAGMLWDALWRWF